MAKNKNSSARNTRADSSIKEPVKPRWMRLTKIVMMIFMGMILFVAIIGMVIRYYRHFSKS